MSSRPGYDKARYRERTDCPLPRTNTHRTLGAQRGGCICTLHATARTTEAPARTAKPYAPVELHDLDAALVARMLADPTVWAQVGPHPQRDAAGAARWRAARYATVRLLVEVSPTHAAVAERLDVAERTVDRWLTPDVVGEPPEFDAAYLDALRAHEKTQVRAAGFRMGIGRLVSRDRGWVRSIAHGGYFAPAHDPAA